MPDYLLAAHIQVTGGAEAAAQLQQVQVQINNFSNAAKTAGTGQMAGDFEKAAQSGGIFSKVMDQAGTALIRMATYRGIDAVASGIRNAADAVLDFDSSMVNSLSIQQGVTSQMRAQMEGMAESIAIKFGEAPAKVAEGFYFMASAGLSAEQQIATLPGVMEFAKAGMLDLGQATEMLFDALAAIGQKSDDPRVLAQNLQNLGDLLSEGAIKSQATIEQMGDALTNKAGNAIKAFDLNLHESVALLEVFANQGVKGNVAGTQFANIMRDMSIKSGKFAEDWKRLGIEVFDSSGHFNSLVTIFKQIDAALLPLSGEERKQALLDLGFTMKDMNSIMGMIGNSDALASFTADLDNAGGVAKRVAETQMEALRAKLGQLSAAFQVGAIEGFQKLEEFGSWLAAEFRPAIEAIVPAAQAMGRGIADVAQGFLALAGGAIKGTLEGIAFAITEIGTFASQHQGAVQLFGFALASLAGAKAIESIVGLGAAIGANLMGKLSEASVMLRVIGSEMLDVIRNGGGMGQALSTGLAGLGELINPVTIAFAAAAATIGVFWKAHADSAREARQAVSGLATAIGAQLGVTADEAAAAMQHLRGEVDGGATSYTRMADAARGALADAVAHKVATEGLSDAFGHLGLTTGEVANAMATGTNVFGDWRAAAMAAHGTTSSMRDGLDKMPPAVRAVAEALLNAKDSGQITFTEFLKLSGVLDGTSDAADGVTEKFATFARETLGAALANGQIDSAWLQTSGIMSIAGASVDQLMNAMDRLDAKDKEVLPGGSHMGEAAREGQQKLQEMGQAADDAEQALKDLKAAFDDFTIPASTMEATARLSNDMLALRDSANKYVAEQGPLASAFETHSKAANDLQIQLGGLVENQAKFSQGQLDQGNTQVAIDGMKNLQQSVIDLGHQYGLTDDQINNVLVSFGLTNEAINNLKPGVTIPVSQTGAEPVAATLDNTANPNGQARKANVQATGTNVDGTWAQMDQVANPGGTARRANIWAFGTNIEGTWAQLNQTANPGNTARQAVMWAMAASGALGYAESLLNNLARTRTAYIDVAVRGMQASADLNAAAGNVPAYPNAEGGIYPAVHAYASGGFENHVAQIQWGGAPLRLWAEPETGGEAYIPLSPGKRARSMQIWEETGRMMGVRSGGPVVNISAPVSVSVDGSQDPTATAQAVASQVESSLASFTRRLVTELQTR